MTSELAMKSVYLGGQTSYIHRTGQYYIHNSATSRNEKKRGNLLANNIIPQRDSQIYL